MGPRRTTTLTLVLLLLSGCSSGGAAGEAGPSVSGSPPVSPTVSPSVSTPTVSAPPTLGQRAWLRGLPRGEPPRLGYVLGHTLYESDGTTTHLPRDRGITSITALGSGWLATDDRTFEGTRGVFRVGPDGRRVGADATIASDPVLGADGSTVYWLTFTPPESGLSLPALVHRADVATGSVERFEITAPQHHLPRIAGVIGSDLYLVDGWEGAITWVTDLVGAPRHLPVLGMAVAVSGRAGLLAGATGGSDRRAGTVVDTATGDVLWRERGVRPILFSPSGRQLLAEVGRVVAVVDSRTGRVERRLGDPREGSRSSLGDHAWEDERHLLVGARHGDRMAVLRVDVRSGRWERVVDWSPAGGTFEVTFETRG